MKVGDSVRHRGIDIGTVTAITLDDDLSGIVASVSIDAAASATAVQGSRFWIVRPQVDLSGVSGLDTAVGSKYLRVIPGDSDQRQNEFRGLSDRPADDQGGDGIELVLRGDDRRGIHAGAPVTYRGIEIGRVLSAGLSPNASAVDVRIRIDEGYRRLVTAGAKFWVNSGFDIDVGMTGVKVNAESLATIAKGGIGMINTATNANKTDANGKVQPGTVFQLYPQRDEDWIEAAVAVTLLQMNPPTTLNVVATWKESLLGISRQKESTSLGLVVADSTKRNAFAVFPADMVVSDPDALPDSFSVGYQIARQGIAD